MAAVMEHTVDSRFREKDIFGASSLLIVKQLFFIIILEIIAPQCFSQSKKFEVRGFLKGKQLTTMVFGYPDANGKIVRDTVRVKNNRFLFSGKIKHPVHAELFGINSENKVSYENYLQVFLEPCRMNLFVETGNFAGYKQEGSRTQRKIEKLNTSIHPIQIRLDVLDKEIRKFKDQFVNEGIVLSNEESNKLVAYKLNSKQVKGKYYAKR